MRMHGYILKHFVLKATFAKSDFFLIYWSMVKIFSHTEELWMPKSSELTTAVEIS